MDDFDHSRYPENTVLSEVMMDVFAHSGAITILYDRTLTQEVLGVEYDHKAGELFFRFTPGLKPFGKKMTAEISETLKQVETVTLIQIDLDTDEAVFGLEVPVKLI